MLDELAGVAKHAEACGCGRAGRSRGAGLLDAGTGSAAGKRLHAPRSGRLAEHCGVGDWRLLRLRRRRRNGRERVAHRRPNRRLRCRRARRLLSLLLSLLLGLRVLGQLSLLE